MFKVNIKHTGSYAEEGQTNPIRWINLKKIDDKTFESASNWWKCKDFLNDLAYTYQTGKSFSIYGWNAGNIPTPPKGEDFWFAVKNLSSDFFHNIENVLNPWLKEQKMPEVKLVKQDPVLLALHPKYFDNTYNISLITLIIRLCNYEGMKFNNFQEVIDCNKFPGGDQDKWDAVTTKKRYFNIPVKFRKYVWYSSPQYNSEVDVGYQISGLVHNNGVVDWGKNW